jgi:predicted acylesterase/phospholipase RssA
VSGVSVGALNAAFIAMYPKGEEIRMITDLQEMLFDMK